MFARTSSEQEESLEDLDNLPDPDVITAAIVEELKTALEQFAGIQTVQGKMIAR